MAIKWDQYLRNSNYPKFLTKWWEKKEKKEEKSNKSDKSRTIDIISYWLP